MVEITSETIDDLQHVLRLAWAFATTPKDDFACKTVKALLRDLRETAVVKENLTVKELCEALASRPEDSRVWFRGRPVTDVEFYGSPGYVVLTDPREPS